MNAITEKLLLTVLSAALSILKSVLKEIDFKEVLDLILNKLEGALKEGSFGDIAIENVTGVLRVLYDIEDSNPDN